MPIIKIIKLGLALSGIALSALLFAGAMRQRRQSVDFPDGTFWVCRSDQHEFVKSLDELAAWYAKNDGPPRCPKCGKADVARAYRCNHRECRHFFIDAVAIEKKASCPICKRPLTFPLE